MSEKQITEQHNIETNYVYQLNNQDLLVAIRNEKKYTSNSWGTFPTWKRLGYDIIKGEKATTITRYVDVENGLDNNGEKKYKTIKRYYNLFNKDQTKLSQTIKENE